MDSYINPTTKLPTTPYKWVPDFVPNGGGDTLGSAWDYLTLERGRFRNDVPSIGGSSGTVTCTIGGTILTPEGSENWPILSAFRPLARPSAALGAAPAGALVLSGADFFWQCALSSPQPVSTVVLTYSLTADLSDLVALLTPDDAQAVSAYLNAGTGASPPKVDWSKYTLGRLTDGTSGTEYPALNGTKPIELQLTGYSGGPVVTRLATIKLGSGTFPSGYPSMGSVRIDNRYHIPSLKLTLSRAMLFNAEVANIREKQLPCSLLQYAYPVSFIFDPARGSTIWPNSFNAPNFHLKMVHPDTRTGAPGMAHSINLRFLIFAMPIYGIAPGDLSSLGGVLASIDDPSKPYLTVFVGPMPGTRSLLLSMLTTTVRSAVGRVVALDQAAVLEGAATLVIQKSPDSRGSTAPLDTAAWVDLAPYDLSAPPALSPSGPFVSPLLYLDKNAHKDDWYRLNQLFPSGASQASGPYRNMLYSERSVMTLSDTDTPSASDPTELLTRRITLESSEPLSDPLQAAPLAVFASQLADPLASPVSLAPGPWTLKIRAMSADSGGLASTHIFARVWLQPEDQSIDPGNLEFLPQTELIFKTTSSGTALVQATPTAIDELIVSPPLSQQLTFLELTRYVDKAPVGGSYSPPFSARSQIAVALYAVSYPTDAGKAAGLSQDSMPCPKVTVEINSDYASLETSVLQTLSGRLFAQRASRLNASLYDVLPQPLVATSDGVGGGLVSGLTQDGVKFPPYSSHLTPAIGGKSPPGGALPGLSVLKDSATATPARFLLAFDQVPAKHDLSAEYYADFATGGVTLASGRVESGNWAVTAILDRGADTAKVGYDLRFEGLLLTTDGIVTERIFDSKAVAGLSDTGHSNSVQYTVNVQVPFLIGAQDTQFVLRVYVYPFSRDGSAVNIASLQKALGTKPFGARFVSLALTSHTLAHLDIHETDSLLGSPAFYEDLPLLAPRSFGSTDFYYVASTDNLKTAITFSEGLYGDANGGGWPIQGNLYAPAGYLALPNGIDVTVGAAGLGANQIGVRTVLASGKDTTSELSVTSVQDPVSGLVHVAHDEPPTDPTAIGKVVRHRQFDTPYGKQQHALVSGAHGSGLAQLSGEKPTLFYSETGPSRKALGLVSLIAQVESTDGSDSLITSAINASHGAISAWTGPNRDLGENSFGDIRRLSSGIKHPVFAHSGATGLGYLAGWAAPGTVVVKEVNIFDAGRTGNLEPGTIYVADGLQTTAIGSAQRVFPPIQPMGANAVETFPALMTDDGGRVTVAYALEGYDGVLFTRITTGGQGFGPAYRMVDLRALGALASSDIAIYGPALTHHRGTGTTCLVFYCAGKLLMTTVSGLGTSQGPILAPLQLVAGSRDFTGKSGGAFAAMRSMGTLRVDQLGSPENDVPRQRPGVFSGERWPSQGSVFVYYYDSDQNLVMRETQVGGVTGSPVTLPSI